MSRMCIFKNDNLDHLTFKDYTEYDFFRHGKERVHVKTRLIYYKGALCVLSIGVEMNELDRINKELKEATESHELLLNINKIFYRQRDRRTAINNTLKEIKTFFKAEYSFIFVFETETNKAHYYISKDGETEKEIENINPKGMEKIVNELGAGEIVCLEKLIETKQKDSKYYTYLAPFYSDNKIIGIFGIRCSITDEKERKLDLLLPIGDLVSKIIEEDKIRRLLEIDDKTGLLKPEIFQTHVSRILQENKGKTFIILEFDIAKFKLVNALYGIEYGDSVLRYIGEYLRGNYIHSLVSSHIPHTDEFFCLFSDKGDENFLSRVKENRKLFSDAYRLPIQFCFGFYRFIAEDESILSIINKASMALKASKTDAAKDGICFYDPTLEMQNNFAQSIMDDFCTDSKGKNFVIYLQGKYDVETNEFVGGEALIRFKTRGGLVSPGVFIPLFEDSAKITDLDLLVIDKVCKYLKKEIKAKHKIVPISVNLSRIDFYRKTLLQDIVKIIDSYHIDHKYIQLEITESCLTDNKEAILLFLQEAKKENFVILMDDFGSGYSSLNVLKELDFQILKIDCMFLKEGDEEKRFKIIKFVVDLAKSLDMEVVIEGVENAQEIDIIKKMGIRFVQGYYYSKPVAENEFSTLLLGGHTDDKEKNTNC